MPIQRQRCPSTAMQLALPWLVWALAVFIASSCLCADESPPLAAASDASGEVARRRESAEGTRFRVARNDSDGWWFLSPDGEPFFSLGVCVLSPGAPADRFNPDR